MTMQTPEEIRELVISGIAYETRYTKKFERRTPYSAPDPHAVTCVIPGIVLSVAVKKGMRVTCNDPLLVLEAMKMQNEIVAPRDGVVRAVRVAPGEAVSRGAVLIELD